MKVVLWATKEDGQKKVGTISLTNNKVRFTGIGKTTWPDLKLLWQRNQRILGKPDELPNDLNVVLGYAIKVYNGSYFRAELME